MGINCEKVDVVHARAVELGNMIIISQDYTLSNFTHHGSHIELTIFLKAVKVGERAKCK